MTIFNKPDWVEEFTYPFESVGQIPASLFDSINARLDAVTTTDQTPVVSVLIAAYNEEINILRCVSSLSRLETDIPFEIIVVNNNSHDQTQAVMDRLHVKRMFQPIQGCGPARQMGQERALGKYILLADADCLYPRNWLSEMMKKLVQPGVVCVYGRYSFIPIPEIPRWQLAAHELMKDVIAEYRHFKRPYLNTYGISMGYVREYGLKAGYITDTTWGDDGRLCFDMMQYGKVVQMKTRSARVWTGPRSLLRDGTFWQAMRKRFRIEFNRFFTYLSPHPPHDTKTSRN